LCDVEERSVRSDETSWSPYATIANSMWLTSETFTMVGYGEDTPSTLYGKLLAAVAVNVGIFFFVALPVTVVGFHFIIALQQHMEKKKTEKFKKMLNNKSVLKVLECANDVVDMELFQAEDQVVFQELSVNISTRRQLEQVLGYTTSGWSYLPFSYIDIEGYPKVSQFKLFVLFGIYGRTHQRERKAYKRQQKKFSKSLASFEQNKAVEDGQIIRRVTSRDQKPQSSLSIKLLPKIRWWQSGPDVGERTKDLSSRTSLPARDHRNRSSNRMSKHTSTSLSL